MALRSGFKYNPATERLELYVKGVKVMTFDDNAVIFDVQPILPQLVEIGGIEYTFPADNGDAGEQLQTDGSGALTWEASGV